MRILLTGACGYVGSVLLNKLLMAGHYVEAIDKQWFGNHTGLPIDPVDYQEHQFKDIDTVIHLAAIANDPTGDLDPKLTWETNALGTMELADRAVKSGVKQFIYASSGSVYGVSKDDQVTEESELFPLSEYNKTKMVAERCVLSYSDKMAVQILRPATVCGLSPRMRLDVAVNLLTMQALEKKEITVLGGGQYRPNIHIEDMTDLYMFMLDKPELTGIYNAGFENLTIISIAKVIAERLKVDIVVKESNDPRSYRMNSEKLLNVGFRPKRTVKMAIVEMIQAYNQGKLKDNPKSYNLRWMKVAA